MERYPVRILSWLGFGLGLLIGGAGLGHSVAVTGTALSVRHALDARWMHLLSIGLSLVAGGAALALSGWKARNGSWPPWWIAGAAAGFLWLQLAILASAFGSVTGLYLFGAYLVAWGLVTWRRPSRKGEVATESGGA